MQIDKREFNPELHDSFKALTVRQPYADLLTRVVYWNDKGEFFAEKRIEVRSRNTTYRGDLLICSSARPNDLFDHPAGVTCGFVELYDVKPVSEFTEDDWRATCIPENERPKAGYGWVVRNPRRVVEMPIKGQLGVYNLIVPKGDITEYPRHIAFGKEGFEKLQKAIKK